MRGCRAAERHITAYLDRELAPKKARWVEGHFRTCPSCRKEVEELRRLTSLLRSLPAPSRAQGYWPQAIVKLRLRVQGLPRPARAPLLERFLGVLEHPIQALVPATLFLVALIKTLAILELEEEATAWFSSSLLPFLLG